MELLKVLLLGIFLCFTHADEYDEDISIGGFNPESDPTIVLRPGDTGPVTLMVGEPFRSECSVEEDDAYSFRWIQIRPDGELVQISSQYLLDLYSVSNEHIEYPIYCEVTRESDGKRFEKRLNVVIDQSYMVNISPLTSTVIVGEEYRMQCRVEPDPGRPVRYTWYHNNQQVGDNQELSIYSLNYRDTGDYICRAEWTPLNARSGPIAANSTLSIELTLTQELTSDMKPGNGSIVVSLPGENRELHCEFPKTMSRPVVRWFFQGQPLEQSRTLNRTGDVFRLDQMRVSIITLIGVKPHHAGQYQCDLNDLRLKTDLIVRTDGALQINPPNDSLDEGQAVEFHCHAKGTTQGLNTQMRWYYRPFGGDEDSLEPLGSYQRGFNRIDHPHPAQTSFINKASVRKSDEGDYVCRLGGDEVVAKLYVRGQVQRHSVRITPSVIRVRAYQPVRMECFASDETGRPVRKSLNFRVLNGAPGFEQPQIDQDRLIISNPQGLGFEYNGTRVECLSSDGMSDTAIIIIDEACSPTERRCRSGECMHSGRFCDGKYDCRDGSDEDPTLCKACDPISKVCEDYRGAQAYKKHYMIHWECDGEDDCGNGYDESRCPDPLVARCEESMFSCSRSNRRIPLAYVCDKDNDCPYGEDELDCSTPVIQGSPAYRFPARLGGSVQLTCRVTGKPIPRVIWRFNWGCLHDEGGRFRVSSRVENCNSPMPTVISTLTIERFQNGDDGIYNCEALAGATRAMSTDYFVVVE